MQPANASVAPSSRPCHFGPAQRRLFGMWHAPVVPVDTRPAVLLCNPFGQEALRAHRMLRVLADRLARVGHPVLRFDYFGSGDSMGDDADADFDGWCDDVRTADLELRQRAAAAATLWIGMRLGGTLALAAAATPPAHLQRLVLWDPILDGARYLEHLRRRHHETLENAFDLPPPPHRPGGEVEDAIGFALSRRFRDQLARVGAGHLLLPHPSLRVAVVCETAAEAHASVAAAAAREPGRVRLVAVDHGVDWTTDEAGDSALVPAGALQVLVQEAGPGA